MSKKGSAKPKSDLVAGSTGKDKHQLCKQQEMEELCCAAMKNQNSDCDGDCQLCTTVLGVAIRSEFAS